MPNQAKIVISAFKTGFFIGALIGLSFYKLLANFLSIKLYHYLLSRDKNYHIDEKGFDTNQVEFSINRHAYHEGRMTEVPIQLAEQLIETQQSYIIN
ncbi:hypothetical protein [Moraxella boevrei]|uniref:hypothetical protein n=1 Tax=Faucicola boevrei TaxID=346665 RepID=UPI00373548C8